MIYLLYLLFTLFPPKPGQIQSKTEVKVLAQVTIVKINNHVFIQTRISDTALYSNACQVVYDIVVEARKHCTAVEDSVIVVDPRSKRL